MYDDRLDVGFVGADEAGPYLDLRCGDSSVRVRQQLSFAYEGDRVSLVVTRIEIYGVAVDVLDHGLTARVWVRPSDSAKLVVSGTLLTPGPM